ncbi:glycosyltransferase family 2 protein [Actinomadura sp. 6N118]|uniref:glycosyltransferase family 2 protein n=1 Tax=Actinomadura sp. 6N118 TaxID=3375151 RepID=UPI0037A5E041
MTPALSVVIPARDVAPHLDDLLRGLAANARADVEFIVIDDGSADRTPEILQEARLDGLTVVRNDHPTGVAAARNQGLALSSGRYVTYLDADDYVMPGYYSDLLAAIESLGCDFVRVDHVQVTGTRRIPEPAPMGRRGVVLDPRDGILPVHENSMVDYPAIWAGIYRRELGELLTMDERLHTAEDRPWVWRLHREAASYAVVSLAGLHYRQRAGSLRQIGDERQLHFFDAFDQVIQDLADDPDRESFLRKAARTYCAIIAFHLKRRDRLSPELRERLYERGRTALRSLPEETLAETLPGMGAERARLFADLLGVT